MDSSTTRRPGGPPPADDGLARLLEAEARVRAREVRARTEAERLLAEARDRATREDARLDASLAEAERELLARLAGERERRLQEIAATGERRRRLYESVGAEEARELARWLAGRVLELSAPGAAP